MVPLDREHLKVTALATTGQDLKVSCMLHAGQDLADGGGWGKGMRERGGALRCGRARVEG
jgi:hypothetical protein